MRQMCSVESLYTNIQTQNAAVDQSQPNSRSRAQKVHVFYLRVECVWGTEAQYRAQLVMVFMSHVVVMSASPYSVCDSQRDGPQLVPNVFLVKWEQKSSFSFHLILTCISNASPVTTCDLTSLNEWMLYLYNKSHCLAVRMFLST